MRNLLYIILSVICLSSCLDEDPNYSLNSKTVYTDVRTAKMALNGCYGEMTTNNTYGQAIQELFIGASGLSWGQTKDDDIDRYTSLDVSPSSPILSQYWSGSYATIKNCNFFIRDIQSSNLNADVISQFLGEAYFIRGLIYFNLLTTFGEVPLRIVPTEEETQHLKKASKAEIISQIKKDLQSALENLPEVNEVGRATCFTAKAFLTKLYWMLASAENTSSSNYWKEAKKLGDEIIQSNKYELEPNFESLFVNHINNSKEVIFQLNFTTFSESSGNRGNWLFAPQKATSGVSWGRNRVSKAFHDWFKGTYPDDPRYEHTFLTHWINTNNKKDIYSYPFLMTNDLGLLEIQYNTAADPTNPKLEDQHKRIQNQIGKPKGDHNGWPFYKKQIDFISDAQKSNKNLILFRYADFLLMMADVENELGNQTEAIKYINKVLTRARTSNGNNTAIYPKNISEGTSQEDLRMLIFQERLFELAGEPSMYTDVRRRGIEFLKVILERHNNHNITNEIATNKDLGTHNFRERLFKNGSLTDDFLKKNLLLPIPISEINGNNELTREDQNFGY